MSAVIIQLKKLLTGKKLYPKTIERAIYDDNGIRLDNKLRSLNRDGVITSSNADYAEVGIWADGNPKNEIRLHKFVTLDNNTSEETISIASPTDDIVGVTVQSPAFSANASEDRFDDNGELLPRYAYVCLMGLAKIIDNGTCTVKGRCIPGNNGNAVPSSNDMGYQVVSRVDENTILVAISPNGEMIQRIKTGISSLESNELVLEEDDGTTGIIRTLKRALTGERIYPTTKIRAIFDDNGNRLDRILPKVVKSIIITEENTVMDGKTLSDKVVDMTSFPDGDGFYLDEKDGKKGYNTSPLRGADTFFPFSSGSSSIAIKLGTTAGNYDVSSVYPDYTNLTSENFIVESSVRAGWTTYGYSKTINAGGVVWGVASNPTKNYNANTGILTVSAPNSSCSFTGDIASCRAEGTVISVWLVIQSN